MEPRRAARALTRWYAANARDLPWRRTHDPYHVLLVEFIMQQTRIDVGTKYYERFIAKYPTIHYLARATEQEVLALWSGLGYYARAKRLHATARRIVDDFGGRVPSDPERLRSLPGIGPYTAGAIASIAYDRPTPAIDGNQSRVLGRYVGARDTTTSSARRRIEEAARRLLAHDSPRLVNQALMDLGSTICVSGVPRCDQCPLASGCATGPRAVPRVRPSGVARPVEDWEALIHVRRGRVWLAAPTGAGVLGALWNPPMRPARRTVSSPHTVQRFSHKTWRIRFVRARSVPQARGRWVDPTDLASLPHGPLTRRTMEVALQRVHVRP